MLVRIRPGPELTGAEREFVDCLRAYPSTGLALVDCQVGDRRLGAVVVTPRGITVIEVKGFRRRQSGLLSLTAGTWTISDNPLELAGDPAAGLTDQVEHGVHAVRVALEQALQDSRHVSGAVVLVPYRGVVVRPARTALRPGLDVLVANTVDAHELRVYLEGFSAGPREWTIDRVLNTCTALGVADLAPAKAELAEDGFDGNRPAPAPIRAQPRRFTEPVTAPPPAEPSRRGKLVGPIVFAAALLGVFVVFLVVGQALLRDAPTPRSTTETTTTTRVIVPTTQRQVECFPFQTEC
ncbi:NERD domain-containing protein [Nocardia neocaledoniensis]|uniref:NERD domain-containing protein n=1 Tax=Nocardia neocaledoniensis TaxID=236511 RepID=UPI002455917E|nr:NERD domain-containing protein [Nocardia neocaledoniensis]